MHTSLAFMKENILIRLEFRYRVVKIMMDFRFSLRLYHCMGPCGICVQFVIDLYHGDRFVAATNHTVKMCIYSSMDYVLDCNLSISVSS